MAKVYYVKDGSYPQNFVDPFGRRLSLNELEPRIQGQDVRYLSKLPPEFNPDQLSPSPQYVVVEVELDEPLGRICVHLSQPCGQVQASWGLTSKALHALLPPSAS